MQMLEELTAFAQENLGQREREALWMRGVSDDQIRLYRIGYLNVSLPEAVHESAEFLEWSWKGRRLDDVFLFPLTNTLGEVKGIQVRHVERSRTGYSDFIPIGDEAIAFGLAQAMSPIWEKGYVVTVEGAFDLFPVQRHEPTVIATIHARISKQLTAVLRRLVSEVWLGFDMDTAGREGCRLFTQYQRDLKAHTINWPCLDKPDGGKTKDPGEIWEALGDRRIGVFLKRLRNPHIEEFSDGKVVREG